MRALNEARILNRPGLLAKLIETTQIASEFEYRGLEPLMLTYQSRLANQELGFDVCTTLVARELLDATLVPQSFNRYSQAACAQFMQRFWENF